VAIPIVIVVVCLVGLIAFVVVRRRRAHEREDAMQQERDRANDMRYDEPEYGRAEFANVNQAPSTQSEYGKVPPRPSSHYETGNFDHMDETALTVPNVHIYMQVPEMHS
jgi:FtsZ-interacting cell division protein ZipA